MIVLDDDGSTAPPAKSPTEPPDSPAQLPFSHGQGPPPAYSTATSSANPGPYPYLLAADAERQRRFPPGENAKRRFFKAFGVALVVWLLFALLIESIDISIRPRNRRKETEAPHVPKKKPSSDGRIDYQACVNDARVPGRTTARFRIPVDADRVSFFNNVSSSSGSFNLEAKPRHDLSMLDQENIDVDVELKNGGWEVWIMPDSAKPSYFGSVQYAIRALVPPGYIKALHTDLPIATHNIGTNGTLIDNVHFGELNLQTANARISSGYVSAERTSIRTLNMPIFGDFSFSKSIELVTKNSPLNVDVRVNDSVASLDGNERERSIIMRTLNGQLEASIHLPAQYSLTPESRTPFGPGLKSQSEPKSEPPVISIDASTKNAGLSILVHSFIQSEDARENVLAPITSSAPSHIAASRYGNEPAPALHISANSINGAVSVAPGDLFVGTFRVEARGGGGCAWVGGADASVAELAGSESSLALGGAVVETKTNTGLDGVEVEAVDRRRGLHRVIDVSENSDTTDCGHQRGWSGHGRSGTDGRSRDGRGGRDDSVDSSMVRSVLVEGRTWWARASGSGDRGTGDGHKDKDENVNEKVAYEGWVQLQTTNGRAALKL